MCNYARKAVDFSKLSGQKSGGRPRAFRGILPSDGLEWNQLMKTGGTRVAKPKAKTLLESGRIIFLPVDELRPNPAQPRRIFDETALQELAASIRQYGVLQPLSVRRRADGYELVAGERRLRAAKLAGLRSVPCVLLVLDDTQSGLVALVENLQRKDLDYLEEAAGLAQLIRRYGLSQEQAAARIGKSQSAVANKLRLLQLSAPVLQTLRACHLSERHARALLRLPDEASRLAVIEKIVKRQLNVAATEALIAQLLQPKPQPAPRRPVLGKDIRLFLNSLEHNLTLIRDAGIAADTQRQDTEQEIILTIRIPRQAG